jgi:hypothetical protein
MDDQKRFHDVHTGSRIASGSSYDRGKSAGSAVNLTRTVSKTGPQRRLAGC